MQRSCSKALPVPCYGKYHLPNSDPVLTSHADRPRKPHPAEKKSGSCLPSHANNIRTRGAHEFYNMMWDPSVYRGNTLKPFEKSEMERCYKKRRDMDNIKRRKFPKKTRLFGGIERPRISLEDQVSKIGLGDMGMQTDMFLQEMNTDVTKKDTFTQVDTDAYLKKGPIGEGEHVLKPFTIGVSQTCQTDCELSFPFEEVMTPLQKELCTKIMEQSLLETTEELELESLRKDKRKYIESRSEELFQLKRAIDAQRVVAEERLRVMQLRDHEAKIEKEAESRLSAALFSSSCMGGLWPITMSVLKLEGFTQGTGSNEIYEALVPWMDEAVKQSHSLKYTISRKLLDEMLNNVASRREADIASNQFLNPSSVNRRDQTLNNISLSEDDLQNSAFPDKTKSSFFEVNYDDDEEDDE